MNETYDFRILIIDDNVQIHHDFIKVLTNTQTISDVDEYKQKSFNEQKTSTTYLPKFLLDTASQGYRLN